LALLLLLICSNPEQVSLFPRQGGVPSNARGGPAAPDREEPGLGLPGGAGGAGDGSGEVIIGYDVKASKPADSVGVESIEFYTEDGKHVKSVTGSTRNGLVRNDSIFCAGDYKCSLPSGEAYYAEVTVFAEVGSDYDSRTITTSTIQVH
jgi:hypothetical protein